MTSRDLWPRGVWRRPLCWVRRHHDYCVAGYRVCGDCWHERKRGGSA